MNNPKRKYPFFCCSPGGYLLVSACVLIVVVAFFVGVLANMALTNSRSVAGQKSTTQAFYIAQAGLEYSVYKALLPSAVPADFCEAMQDDPHFVKIPFGKGQFTVTAKLYQEDSGRVYLARHINANDNMIPINCNGSCAAVLAPSGRVLIDSELIGYYDLILADGNVCRGASACLVAPSHSTGIPGRPIFGRGADGTIASNHSVNTIVKQNQCHLEAQGGVPDLDNPVAKRELSREILYPISAAEAAGWMIGVSDANKKPAMYYLSNNQWMAWNQSPPLRLEGSLRAAATIDKNHAWAVGDNDQGRELILKWNGAIWSRIYAATPVKTSFRGFKSISCPNESFCFAVGNQSIYKYSGQQWKEMDLSGIISSLKTDISAVSCASVDFCVAVGSIYAQSGSPSALIWNGITWSLNSSLSFFPISLAIQLQSIACPSYGSCRAIGRLPSYPDLSGSYMLFLYDGGRWRQETIQMDAANNWVSSIACASADSCWMINNSVNNNRQTFLLYTQSSSGRGQIQVVSSGACDHQLDSLSCYNGSNCWAVGYKKRPCYINNSGGVWAPYNDVGTPALTTVGLANTSRNNVLPRFWGEKY